MEKVEDQKKRKRLIIILSIAGAIILLSLLIFLTPLKDVFFSSDSAPTIELEIVEGPEVDEETGLYSFLVEAVVTGDPEPEVTFNRNDGDDELDLNHTLILLEKGESFLLTATATNTLGSAEVSLSLMAEDEDADPSDPDTDDPDDPDDPDEPGEDPDSNEPPEISGITFPDGPLYAENDYVVSVDASDPDGDPLTYHWEISGPGTPQIADPLTNPMLWTPGERGEYTVKITVRDNRGEKTEYSENVNVGAIAFLKPVNTESGYVIKDEAAHANTAPYIGDNADNRICRGFISFDISGITGTVQKAELRLADPEIHGNPEFMHGGLGLWVAVVEWGSRPPELADYGLQGKGLDSFTSYNITLTSAGNQLMARELQDSIDAGNDRFQFRLHFALENSNGDDSLDGVAYHTEFVTLTVYYE